MSIVLNGSTGITFPDSTGPFDGADLQSVFQKFFGYGAATGGEGGTVYFGEHDATVGSTETTAASLIGRACNATALYASVVTAPTGSETDAFTLMKNGSATTITCTITGSATTANDTAHTVSYAAGDTISLRVVYSSGSPSTWSNNGVVMFEVT
mgnify:CR=1 FL=1